MPSRLTRRTLLIGTVSGLALSGSRWRPGSAASEISALIADLERQVAGRLGVAVLDTGTGAMTEHRGDERFPMCSTFKVLAAALVLARVDRDEEELARRIVFTESAIVPHSPVTESRIGGAGMMLAELCEAAITQSDNTAANLLLESFGGPPALTAYARSLGDAVTRLDRIEPALNEALPGDPRDTTTPAAMLGNLRQLVLGDTLSAGSRQLLTAWLSANTAGDTRLRAGFPPDWRVADKTGSSLNGVANDIAVVWPPGREALVVTAYLAESTAVPVARDAALAVVARRIADSIRY